VIFITYKKCWHKGPLKISEQESNVMQTIKLLNGTKAKKVTTSKTVISPAVVKQIKYCTN